LVGLLALSRAGLRAFEVTLVGQPGEEATPASPERNRGPLKRFFLHGGAPRASAETLLAAI